jgi:hypothetical protein
MKIWVVYGDSDWEGCTHPLGLFHKEEDAEAFRLKLEDFDYAYKIIGHSCERFEKAWMTVE